MLQELVRLNLGVIVYRVGVVLDVLDHKLMNSHLLGSVEHDLVDSLSQEALPEAADGILGVGLVQDLHEVSLLKGFQEVHDLLMRLVPEGADVLKRL